MSRTLRWGLAVASVLALTYATIPSLPSITAALGHDDEAPAATSAACPASAKKANLNFTVNDMHGKAVKLSDYKGKVIVLDFWATWCGPCKIEIPGFVELQKTYGPQGLAVIGISVDDTVDKLKPFAREFQMNYPVLVGLGRDDVQDAFGPIWGIPTTFIIARDGRICRKNTGVVGKQKYERDIKGLL